MNIIDSILCSVHYHNQDHRTLTYTSWNLQKIIGKLTRRYESVKNENGLILQESVTYERQNLREVKE